MKSSVIALAAAILLLGANPAVLASDHGGGGGGPSPMKFVTNLPSARGDRYLMVELVLEAASPEVEHEIAGHLPKIQHRIILLLSAVNDDKLRTVAGKNELADMIQTEVNKLLHSDARKGVKDVLFTNFIIQ